MRLIFVALLLLIEPSGTAQSTSASYTYSAYKDPPNPLDIIGGIKEDIRLFRRRFSLPVNEVDPFDFEEEFGDMKEWNCNALGKHLMGVGTREFFGRVMSEDEIKGLINVRATVVLNDNQLNQVFKDRDPFCTLQIQNDSQVRKLSAHFRKYAGQPLELPWYEGLLSESLGKFSTFWTVGKTGIDLLIKRKPNEIIAAASMTALIAKGGELRRVVYVDKSTWDYFETVTEYSVQVGMNEHKTHVPLYSLVYKIKR
jgi:hypothetical protein